MRSHRRDGLATAPWFQVARSLDLTQRMTRIDAKITQNNAMAFRKPEATRGGGKTQGSTQTPYNTGDVSKFRKRRSSFQDVCIRNPALFQRYLTQISLSSALGV